MIPKWTAIGVVLLGAPAAQAVDGAPQQEERILLSCTGTMIGADQEPPGSRILATATVDFLKMQVDGFGIGRAPIILTSATEVRFGSSPLEMAGDARTIDGAIDRDTGRTKVVVRSANHPRGILIAMTLDCRSAPPIS